MSDEIRPSAVDAAGPAPTLADVARHAGVSIATASRAINGSDQRRVGAELAERVRKSAQLLGYAPDANAQAMARGNTRAIGVAVNDLSDSYFAAVADSMAAAAQPLDLFLTIASTSGRKFHEVIQHFESLRVRAIVLVGGQWQDTASTAALRLAIERYRARGGRVVCVGANVQGTDCVLIDNAGGMTALADQLFELGYRNPILFAGPAQHSTSAARVTAFAARCRELGIALPESHVINCEFSRRGGVEAMEHVLDQGLQGDVIVSTSDVMAIGAMVVARRAGAAIPAGYAFTGWGDIEHARDMVPELTTIAIPTADLGRLAIELASQGPGDGSGTTTVPVELKLRASTPRKQA